MTVAPREPFHLDPMGGSRLKVVDAGFARGIAGVDSGAAYFGLRSLQLGLISWKSGNAPRALALGDPGLRCS